MSDKTAARRAVRAALDRMDRAEQVAADTAIQAHLAAFLPGRGDVLAYAAMPDEVDLDPLLDAWAAAGRLLLPRVEGSALTLHRIGDRARDLVPGTWGIREPDEHVTVVEDARPAVVVLPGRAFDRAGGRLGRGGGFYDRLVPSLAGRPLRVGVARSVQLVDAVPSEPHDVLVDVVVTEHGVIRAGDLA